MSYRFRNWLVESIGDVYRTPEALHALPGWFLALLDWADPHCFLGPTQFYGWDPAAVDQRVVFEDGEWWCYSTPRPSYSSVIDFHMHQIANALGIPKHLLACQ